jgi:hypothetical protein
MNISKNLNAVADAKSLGDFLVKQSEQHGHGGHHRDAAREVEHCGHRIAIKTHYQVTVDGKGVELPIGVDEYGEVHCHALPYVQFPSAVDLVKAMIDAFPDELLPHHRPRGKRAKSARRPTKKKPRAKKASRRGGA